MPEISEVLRAKLIPGAQHEAGNRFIVARPKMRKEQMPDGVLLARHHLSGRRVLVKDKRAYKNVRNVIALWPNDGLHELGKHALVCVLGGHVRYTLGKYSVRCGPRHFIFVPPGIPHPDGSRTYVDLERSNQCDIITFLLHPNAVECWMSHGHAEGRESSNYCLILHPRVIALLQALMEEVIEAEPRSHLIGEWLLLAFLNTLEREVDAGRLQYLPADSPRPQPDRISDSSQTDFVSRLEEYVQTHMRSQMTLERVARDMYLSPAQFTRVVRRETGGSFKQFLNTRRLEEAKTLLRNSEWTISTIAGMLGFKSANYFGDFFKHHAGETPGSFRLRSR